MHARTHACMHARTCSHLYAHAPHGYPRTHAHVGGAFWQVEASSDVLRETSRANLRRFLDDDGKSHDNQDVKRGRHGSHGPNGESRMDGADGSRWDRAIAYCTDNELSSPH